VVRYRGYIAAALARPIDFPDAMPVTRDLATWKRAMIIKWLTTPGANGLPKRDLEEVVVVDTAASPRPEIDTAIDLGGKTTAALRTPALRARVEAAIKLQND
jgi:hypothetical protein